MRSNRRIQGVGIAAVIAIGFMGVSGVASADEEDMESRATPNLTVHRLRGVGSTPGNGEEIKPAPDLIPIGGAQIELSKVNCLAIGDLTTDAQVEAAYKMMEDIGAVPTKDQLLAVEGCSLAAVGTKTTSDMGNAYWKDLQRGLYFGEEIFTPEGYETADPFVAMVPMTSANGIAYNWDVHVYPKSNRSISEVGKMILSQWANALGKVTYAVRSEIHKYSGGMTYFAMTDHLDNRLRLVGGHKVSIGDRELVLDRDYQVSTAGNDSRALIMWLTESGLNAHELATPYVDIVWQFDVEMSTKGIIPNTASVWENKNPIVWENGTTAISKCKEGMVNCLNTAPVETRYGSVDVVNTIYKTNEPGVGAAIEFRYADVAPTVNAAAAKVKACGGTLIDTEVTSNAGKITTIGFRSSEYMNGRKLAPEEEGYRYYCATQIKAPAGTELIRESRPFVITGDTEPALHSTKLVFQNVKQNAGFQLPLTGGIGLGVFGVIGALLMGYAVLKSRRTAHRNEGSLSD